MELVKYLKKHKCITGPLPKNSSNSHIQNLLKNMLGVPTLEIRSEWLVFGNALHEVFLEGIYDTYNMLDRAQQCKIDAMVTKLQRHSVVRKLMQNSIREQKLYGTLFGMEMSFILDIKQEFCSVGSDLKTTTANNYHECVKRAFEYGYHKQAYIYKRLAKVKEFYFIFINKSAPYNIFIVDSKVLGQHDKYIEQELKFLFYFYKTYGNINLPIAA